MKKIIFYPLNPAVLYGSGTFYGLILRNRGHPSKMIRSGWPIEGHKQGI